MGIFSSILQKICPSAQAKTTSGVPQAGSESGSKAISSADVLAILKEMQAKNPENLNWKTSIVDLLKLLKLDSSLVARKRLAIELGYTGSQEDSVAMNTWLHKVVMQKLAENGGSVPNELK